MFSHVFFARISQTDVYQCWTSCFERLNLFNAVKMDIFLYTFIAFYSQVIFASLRHRGTFMLYLQRRLLDLVKVFGGSPMLLLVLYFKNGVSELTCTNWLKRLRCWIWAMNLRCWTHLRFLEQLKWFKQVAFWWPYLNYDSSDPNFTPREYTMHLVILMHLKTFILDSSLRFRKLVKVNLF